MRKPKYYTGLITLSLLVLFLVSGCTGTNNNNPDITKKKSLQAEIGELGDSGTYLRVINRNDYDWHNVKITVNDYYSCWSRDILKPEEVISVNAVTCNQFVINQNVVYSLTVVADEGQTDFTR
ncbi:hypothetical protein CEE44_02935 [Candidatus Woesearchaeota archaeon B3_Woes]|nr:MAG: hypothetical protein CEE44_02935 [Candidatus Woesearchaeota archaeon B3_Woes]